ncbi:MAG: aminoacyl-tRNA hydrolase [Alyxoria varia]|nr:MAG: aminoacyl-tRNA hydrolase [Alyxoria varia]
MPTSRDIVNDEAGMRPLLIASLGNPGSNYANTLHSAGHILLNTLSANFGGPVSGQPGYGNAPVAHCTHSQSLQPKNSETEQQLFIPITFYRSPSYMNVSGPSLAKAWRTFGAQNTADPAAVGSSPSPASLMKEPRLVILHDELELPLGKFKVSSGKGRSARGHNGLKSVMEQQCLKGIVITRVGVGIGPRPQSRDPEAVAKYVLGKMKEVERERVGGLAGPVLNAIEKECLR